jgi:MoxR-like ATPase
MMSDVQTLQSAMAAEGYVATDDLAMAVHLALTLGRPLLLEGAAGVGKTEVAKGAASGAGHPADPPAMLRGLDASQAIYEWNYQRQLARHPRRAEAARPARPSRSASSPRTTCCDRPLLQAIRQDKARRFC